MSSYFSPLLFLPAGSTEDHLRKQIEFLKAENEMLRIQSVGRTTVRTILKEEGVHTGPKRGPSTWHEFVTTHAETLWQFDFFSKARSDEDGLQTSLCARFPPCQLMTGDLFAGYLPTKKE